MDSPQNIQPRKNKTQSLKPRKPSWLSLVLVLFFKNIIDNDTNSLADIPHVTFYMYLTSYYLSAWIILHSVFISLITLDDFRSLFTKRKSQQDKRMESQTTQKILQLHSLFKYTLGLKEWKGKIMFEFRILAWKSLLIGYFLYLLRIDLASVYSPLVSLSLVNLWQCIYHNYSTGNRCTYDKCHETDWKNINISADTSTDTSADTSTGRNIDQGSVTMW